MPTKPHIINSADAPRIVEWLQTRGGIRVWENRDIGGDSNGATTPAKTKEGADYPSPHWRFGQEPARTITDPADVEVATDVVVETITIKLKSSGHRMVLNNASDRRVRAALERAGEGSYYTFGIGNDPAARLINSLTVGEDICTIWRQAQVTPLPLWLQSHAQS